MDSIELGPLLFLFDNLFLFIAFRPFISSILIDTFRFIAANLFFVFYYFSILFSCQFFSLFLRFYF